MDFTCNECGKVYKINTNKLESYRGRLARFRCQVCNTLTDASQIFSQAGASEFPLEDLEASGVKDKEQKIIPIIDSEQFSDSLGLGLRTKMLFWFLIIPVFLAAGAVSLFDHQLDQLSGLINKTQLEAKSVEVPPEIAELNNGDTQLVDLMDNKLSGNDDALNKKFNEMATNVRTTNIFAVICALIVFSLSSIIFSFSITYKLRHLTEIADRISLGDLGANIEIMSKNDEIGDLAEAIGRMQDSLSFSVKALQRKRSR
jgi:HAMP domain-containing protein